MADAALIVAAAELTGANGYQLNSAPRDRASFSVGDINGDGFDDLFLPNPEGTGEAYVLFGGPTLASVTSLSSVNGLNGFRLAGTVYEGYAAFSAAGIGDINGDGFNDLILSAPYVPYSSNPGVVYVVFGAATFAASVPLGDFDGTTGFVIAPPGGMSAVYGGFGFSVNGVGDVNGDGLDDFSLAANSADQGFSNSGSVWIVYGTGAASAPTFNLSTIDGTNGFRMDGGATNVGASGASSFGDINGDGYDDMLVGGGSGFVVFGQAGGMHGLQLSGLDGVNGFALPTTPAGLDVRYTGLGDINDDGYDDFAILKTTSTMPPRTVTAQIVYGKASGFEATLDWANAGAGGFTVTSGSYNLVKSTIANAGDLNGDGVSDFAISLSPFGYVEAVITAKVYVIYGRTDAMPTNIDLTTLTADQGFIVDLAYWDFNGALSMSTGDVNGDGNSDLVMSSPWAAALNVLYGQGPVHATGSAGNDTLTGRAFADLIRGGDMGDVLNGAGGNDRLYGEAGGDILNGDAGNDQLDGGDGADKLFGGIGNDTLTGGLGNDRLDGGDGTDSLLGGDGNDTLDGGAGTDTLTGGLGNDIYILAAGDFDAVVEAADEGYDIVRADRTATLAANVEGLELQGTGDHDGTGNGGANNLQGNGGNNRLDGGAGVDTINGNDGDDVIIGGEGNDLLRGGIGADTFRVAHSFGAVLETDQIYDFSAAEGDIMDFSDAFAGTLSVVTAFSKQAGQMTLAFAGGLTTVRLDINGDGKVDYQVKINGDVTGDTGDWLL